MVNLNIRDNIISNFKGINKDEIKTSISESIKEKEEVTLPGLGVFFEIIWKNSDDDLKKEILNILERYFK